MNTAPGLYGNAGVKWYNGGMFLVGILGWWYGAGWKQRAAKVKQRLEGTIDYFSIDLLVRTLFSPFRQISAGQVNGSIQVKMRAFFDRMLSRVIGAIVRLGMIIIGIIAIALSAVIGVVGLVIWALVPIFPVIAIGMFATGWMPWITM